MPYIIIGVIIGIVVLALIIIFSVLDYTHKKREYDNTEYAKQTGLSYQEMKSNSGAIGEYNVSRIIGETNYKDRYVIHDLTIELGDKSSQIDYVVIQSNGVFVIETKNYAGRIYGSEEAREWTQVLAYGNTKNKFYNPIKQNKSHIYYLSKKLGMHDIFVSCVCFVKASLIPDIDGVGFLGWLGNILQSNTGIKIYEDEMKEIYDRLMECKNNGISKQEHVRRIKKQYLMLTEIFVRDAENH